MLVADVSITDPPCFLNPILKPWWPVLFHDSISLSAWLFQRNKEQWENLFIASELSRKDHWPVEDKTKRPCRSDTNVSYTFLCSWLVFSCQKYGRRHSVVLTNASTSRALRYQNRDDRDRGFNKPLIETCGFGTVGSHKIVQISSCRRTILVVIVEWQSAKRIKKLPWRGARQKNLMSITIALPIPSVFAMVSGCRSQPRTNHKRRLAARRTLATSMKTLSWLFWSSTTFIPNTEVPRLRGRNRYASCARRFVLMLCSMDLRDSWSARVATSLPWSACARLWSESRLFRSISRSLRAISTAGVRDCACSEK